MDILDRVRPILAEQFGVSEADIQMDSSLRFDLGYDDLDAMALGMALEGEFDIELDEDELEAFDTVGDIVPHKCAPKG